MSAPESVGQSWPDEHPELIPFIPLVVAIWSDGIFTEEDYGIFTSHVDALTTLAPDARRTLTQWMSPATPPSSRDIVRLRRRIRAEATADTPDSTRSLADLGAHLWRRSHDASPWDAGTVEQLHSLEEALGLLGGEAVRRLLGIAAPQSLRDAGSSENSDDLRAFLDGDRGELRRRVLTVLQSDDLTIAPALPSAEYREQVLAAVRVLAEEGLGSMAFPVEYGGSGDPGGSVAVFETLAYGDLSVLVKFGVQFGLFGGSVHQLGTTRHHEAWLPRIGSLDLPGCYAMTETGHGSNVRDLETTAHFDAERGELVVHTPNRDAGKDWIGNAACHGQLATVFARLIVDDEDHGVHAVLVPIRSRDGTVAPGVTIEDRGLKLGLNGVDNGRIWFDQVRVPVDNLLDRFASIDAEGRYQSPIPSDGRRFFTMLRTLVAGRVSIASASVSATKVGLTIALRYTAGRTQFGPQGAPESPLLGYLALQRALVPRLATTFGLHFAVRALQARFEAAVAEDDPELEVLAASLKAYASDHCVTTLQAAREACGGQGYLADNRFAALRADTDIFTTFEGANLVLYQLVSKGLLSRYREEMGDLDLRGALRYLGDRAETSLTELNPVVTRRTDPEHLQDPEFLLSALLYRENRLLRSVAMRMRSRLRGGVDSFEAVNEVQDHLIALAQAHVERVIAEEFDRAIGTAPSEATADTLRVTFTLFALSRIEADRAWFLESGYVEPVKSRAIRATVNELCDEVSAHAADLVAAFGIPHALLPEIARTP